MYTVIKIHYKLMKINNIKDPKLKNTQYRELFIEMVKYEISIEVQKIDKLKDVARLLESLSRRD